MKDDLFKDVYLGQNLAYLRPYICRRNPYQSKVFLTGINPATPIYPEDVGVNEYLKIMENYNEFMNFYVKNRKKQNKPEISRTRMGINALVEWIENECGTGVVETDIFTYPTKNIKELIKIDNKVLNKSKEKFWQVLMEFKPDIIVLYGALTVDTFQKLLKEKNLEAEFFDKNQEHIEDLEKLYPFARINVDSKNIDILACRHLMYYGKERKEF